MVVTGQPGAGKSAVVARAAFGLEADRQQIAETLSELAILPALKVADAIRAIAAGSRYAPGGLLVAFGVSAASSPNLVDLDTGRYFHLAGLEEFAAALLAQGDAIHPGPPGLPGLPAARTPA